jgi:hypothetical protein
VLSWAEVGQPGIGHVNCVSQEYAIENIKALGFQYDSTATAAARKNIDECTNWFRKTLLIFDRP